MLEKTLRVKEKKMHRWKIMKKKSYCSCRCKYVWVIEEEADSYWKIKKFSVF